MKSAIKKKMLHNKKELAATGGGQNKLYSFSRLEESIISMLNLEQMVNPAGKVFGLNTANILGSSAETETVDDLLSIGMGTIDL